MSRMASLNVRRAAMENESRDSILGDAEKKKEDGGNEESAYSRGVRPAPLGAF